MQDNLTTLQALASGTLTGTTNLNLQSCNLNQVPEAVLSLAESLEVLSLNNNQLSTLPDWFSKLTKLKILFCSNNPFTELPTVLGQCPALEMIGFKACNIQTVPEESLPKQLRWLILTNNQLQSLPDSIGDCQHLEKFMLAGNQLKTLPQSLSRCNNLALLRISANQFSDIPPFLLSMPKLAWLALAGNPFNRDFEQTAIDKSQLTNVDWQALSLNQQLGEGASGDIFHADWQQTETELTPVAVKVFKGEMTSDGLPTSELAAAVTAGKHPHLTSTIGLVNNHPQGKQATIMALLDPAYKVLAGPPSFGSCSRDVYNPEFKLPVNTTVRVALQIAKATQHLHQKGLIHGDLYAHNILLNDEGDCLLSDFGGASFQPNDKNTAKQLQQIETRAFGYLLEELIAHSEQTDMQESALEALIEVKNQCLSVDPQKRPLMKTILDHIDGNQS